MKTARITFLIELGVEPRSDHIVSDKGAGFGLALKPVQGCQVIGEPRIEVDDHHRCSMSAAQLLAALRAMRQYGGGFAGRLADLLEVSDGGNTEKLLDAFHDLLWGYVPMGLEVRG